MKLSANARAFVMEQVKSAFAEEYKKAEEAKSTAEEKADKKWKAFEKDLSVVAEKARREAMAVIKKHGLTMSDHDDNEITTVRFQLTESYYSSIDFNSFMETSDGPANPEIIKATKAIAAVNDKIQKATSKALFEIEVHGKKDTLEEIVSEVIKSIKEEK